MTPRIIPNWRRAWRMASVRVGALAVAWGLTPPEQQEALLAWVGLAPERVPAVLGLLFIAGRLLSQPATRDP